MSETSSAPAPRELFLRFTQVSLSGIGGVMPFARRMLVEERRWLSAEEFTDILSLCQWPAFAITALTAAVVLTTRIHPLWLFGAAGLIGLAGWL